MTSPVPRTCPACLEADHDHHQYGWNLNHWNGKGCYCPCEGECIALLDRRGRMLLAYGIKKEG